MSLLLSSGNTINDPAAAGFVDVEIGVDHAMPATILEGAILQSGGRQLSGRVAVREKIVVECQRFVAQLDATGQLQDYGRYLKLSGTVLRMPYIWLYRTYK